MVFINYKTNLLTLLAMLVLWFPTDASAQQLQASLSHYTTDNGLPSNTIAALHNDDYGFVWIATWNGISRFDGYNFYNYRTGITSGVKGLHNRIDRITTDQMQNVWMKMYDGRVFVLNRQTDRIEDPLAGINGHDGFIVDYFFVPYVTSVGDVLMSFGETGFYKLRLDRNGLKQEQIMTRNMTVKCVVEGYHNDLWVGTDQGVHRINTSNLSLEKDGYFLDEDISCLASNGYNIFAGTKSGKIMEFSYGQEPKTVKDFGKEITGLFVDSNGLIWFSDSGDGAYRLNPDTGDVKFFNQRVLVPEYTSRGAEFTEALGLVWVRMNHGGYGYYNRESDEVEYFHNDPSNPWNLSNSVNARLEMNDGVVWESTIRRGLEKLEILKRTITRTLVMPESEHPMDNEVRAMCYDAKRHLTFLCNKRGKIFIYDAQGNHTGTITQDAKGTPISRPYGMSMDSQGNYWVCDKDKGVFKITPTGGGYNVQNICHTDGDAWSLSSNAAYQAVEDHDGNIWIATYGGGVNILRKNKAGKYIAIHAKNALKRYPQSAHQKVRTLAVAKDGKVWAGTTDGILIMQMRNNNVTIEEMRMTDRLEDGLMSNDIVYLASDAKGTMWIGTNSGGLSYVTGRDEHGGYKFKNYGIADGLPSEEIRGMAFDEKGNVWFSTDHVLSSFDVKKQIFTTYSQLDGVDETMCSEGSVIMGEGGNILIGTLNGYYTIDRKKLKNATGSLLKLRITDFYLDDELQSPRLNDTYDFYVPESRKVELPSHSSAFAFRFAALNYQLQHRMVYQYKLDGYDRDWVNADKTRTAHYHNVPAGTYRFQVKAFLLESPEAYDTRSIEITVPPSPLLSPAAVWVYMVLMAVGMLFGLWWYQERLRKQQQGQYTMFEQEQQQ
jgi:ligand-binding sensor domain-containing protein